MILDLAEVDPHESQTLGYVEGEGLQQDFLYDDQHRAGRTDADRENQHDASGVAPLECQAAERLPETNREPSHEVSPATGAADHDAGVTTKAGGKHRRLHPEPCPVEPAPRVDAVGEDFGEVADDLLPFVRAEQSPEQRDGRSGRRAVASGRHGQRLSSATPSHRLWRMRRDSRSQDFPAAVTSKYRRARPPRRGSGSPSLESDESLVLEAPQGQVDGRAKDGVASVRAQFVHNRDAVRVRTEAEHGEQDEVFEFAEDDTGLVGH